MRQKNVQHLIDSGKPIGQTLEELRKFPMEIPSKLSLLHFARNNLHITPDHEDAWYREAWWGYYASLLVRNRIKLGKFEAVAELIDPIDWQPLETTLQEGRGAIVAAAHVGLAPVCKECAHRSNYDFLSLNPDINIQSPRERSVTVSTHKNRQTSLVKSLSYLRDGGPVLCAPDGRIGTKYLSTRFLGQEVKLFQGIGELARVSQAPTLWYTASWASQERIRVYLEPIMTPGDLDPEKWIHEWYASYLDKLDQQMRTNPADLGFLNGLWVSERGGLDWYQPPPFQQKLINKIKSVYFDLSH